MGLEVLANGFVSLAQERVGLGALDLVHVALNGERIPVEEITAPRSPVEGDLIGTKDETGEGVSGVAHAGEVAPGARGITRVHPNAIAVDAAGGFAGGLLARRAAQVAQDKL